MAASGSKQFLDNERLVTLPENARSSRPEVFCKKGVFEISQTKVVFL